MAEEATERSGRRDAANCGDGAVSHGGKGLYPLSGSRTGIAGQDRRRSDSGSPTFLTVAMVDLSRIRKYYVACGYTDLRRGNDGLAGQQYGRELRERPKFCVTA